MSSRLSGIVPALLVIAAPAVAAALDEDSGSERTLVWYCHDPSLAHTTFPGCAATSEALRVEIGGTSLQVLDVPAEAPVPADPRLMSQAHGAIFLAWVIPASDGDSYLLYAYDALNDQFLSKEVDCVSGSDPPDAAAVAFLYRNMLGTSLFSDLEFIETDVDLWGLAFPEDKVEKVKNVEGLQPPGPIARVSTLHLGISYQPIGYPVAKAAWHAASIGFHFEFHEYLEGWVESGATPGPVESKDSTSGLGLELWLLTLQTGIRVRALSRGPFTLLPGVGLGLDLAFGELTAGETDSHGTDHVGVHGSAITSVLGRFMFHPRVGLGVEFGAQVLFNTEKFCIDDPIYGECDRVLLRFGQVGLFARVGVVFGF